MNRKLLGLLCQSYNDRRFSIRQDFIRMLGLVLINMQYKDLINTTELVNIAFRVAKKLDNKDSKFCKLCKLSKQLSDQTTIYTHTVHILHLGEILESLTKKKEIKKKINKEIRIYFPSI